MAGCATVELAFTEVLCAPGGRIDHVYFPTSSFVSLVMPVDDSASLEVGPIGNEGMFGIPLALGVGRNALRTRQNPCEAAIGAPLTWRRGEERRVAAKQQHKENLRAWEGEGGSLAMPQPEV
jgi:hypothetical protein